MDNVYTQPGYTPNPPQFPVGETEEQRRNRAKYFSVFALPTLIYAAFYTFFLYQNTSSITMPFFVAASGVYVWYCMKKCGIAWKAGNYAYLAVMLLLGISDACTGSLPLLFFNNVGLCLVFLCMLLHSYFDDRGWTLGKYVTAGFTAVFGAIGCIGEPFTDFANYRRFSERKHSKTVCYVLLGLLCSLPLLIIVTALLYFADAVFAAFLSHGILLHLNIGSAAGTLYLFLFALFSSYCGIRYLNLRKIPEECNRDGHFEPIVAITGLSLISVVYVFFSGIQILYLFLGNRELPDGYTYAAYAREGFFQLLFVCMINVALVLFVLRFFRENIIVKLLLTVISFCTYIMAAASAYRMILYIQNYNLTFLRILVLWALAVIALLLLGILIMIYWKNFPLFAYGFVIICAAYLALSFGHPDDLIARYNLAQIEANPEVRIDYDYLIRLSSDAAPAMAECPDSAVRKEYFRRVSSHHSASPRKFNFSRERAKRLAE